MKPHHFRIRDQSPRFSPGFAAGSVLYIKAGIEHRFHTIEEDLTVLVVFAATADTH